jgi:hypothetical protein
VPQAHTLTVTTGSRAHRLTPLVAIITTAALFAVALVQGVVNDPPARTGVDKSATPVSGLPPSPAWPDESKLAAGVAARSGSARGPGRPDESKVAAAIGSGSARSTAPFGRTGPSLPTRRWEQYGKAITSLTPAERRAAFGTGH